MVRYGWRSHSSVIATSLSCVSLRLSFSVQISSFGKICLRQKMAICQSRAFKESDFDRSYSAISWNCLPGQEGRGVPLMGLICTSYFSDFSAQVAICRYPTFCWLLLAHGFSRIACVLIMLFFLQCFTMEAHFKILSFFSGNTFLIYFCFCL